MKGIFRRVCCIVLTLILAVLPLALQAAGEGNLAERSSAVANDAKDLAVDAGESVAAEAEALWETVDGRALDGRAGSGMVVWMLVGGLVGAIAGMLASMRSTGFGRLGRVLLGLIGAFLGGLAVRLASLDFGWQPLQIRYEEVLFSFAGAVMLILLWRLLRPTTQKKHV